MACWASQRKGRKRSAHLSSAGPDNFFICDETASKEVKRKKNGSKKSAYRSQSVQYGAWWKQSNIKMAVSEELASYWVHKDFNSRQNKFGLCWASDGKDKCQVRLTGIEWECQMSTGISRLGGYCFRGTATAGDGSDQKEGNMEAGYVNLRGGEEKTAEDGGLQRGRTQLKPSRTSGLSLGITRHLCDKTHALFVRQTSAAESCENMGRRRWKSDI